MTFQVSQTTNLQFLEHVVITASLSVRGYFTEYTSQDFYEELYELGTDEVDEIYPWMENAHPRRGDIKITLTSPQGTESVLLPYRNYDFVNEEGYAACSQLNAKHRMEDPVSEFTGGITWCNPMPNWQSALNLVTTPITAELLQQKIPDFNNVIMQQQSEQSWQLRSAGIPNTDIPVVLEALKRLQAISVCQLGGVHNGSNIPGSHSGLYGCYQMPVLLMDIPHWGVPPRITTRSDVNEEAGKRMNSWLDTKDLLYWKK